MDAELLSHFEAPPFNNIESQDLAALIPSHLIIAECG